jgi:hypothetical protein
MKQLLFVTLIVFSAQLLAQNVIPRGTILPVRLDSSLRFGQARAGNQIRARVMQDVPSPGGGRIRSGSKVLGHIVASSPAGNGTGAEISMRFDTLVMGRQRVALVTNLRALATMMDVADAQDPESGPDHGTSENSWTTDQIGGEVVYRGGPVAHGSNIVGNSVLGSGVLVHVSAQPGQECRGEVAGNDQPQALWVFSSDACGLFDLPDVTLSHAGRTDPVGQITLLAKTDKVKIPSGSGMLLRVDGITP